LFLQKYQIILKSTSNLTAKHLQVETLINQTAGLMRLAPDDPPAIPLSNRCFGKGV
jgi:hypothetical protein